MVRYYQGDFEQAFEVHRWSLAIREAIGDKTGIAGSFANLGLLHYNLGDYELSLEYQQKSLELRQSLGDPALVAGARVNIGIVHHRRGNYGEAMRHYRMGLAEFESRGDQARVAVVLSNMGNVLDLQGSYDLALDYLNRSLQLRRTLGDKRGVVASLDNLGSIHAARTRFELALDCYRQALKIAEEVGVRELVARETGGVGGVLRRQKKYSQAVEQYAKSLAIWESMGQKMDVASTLGDIALCHLLNGEAGRALELAGRGAALAREIGAREQLWACLLSAGRAQRALGRHAEARKALEESIATIESLRADLAGGEREAQPFLEGKAEPYHQMAEISIAQKQAFDALGYAERTKARVLLDVLGGGRAGVNKAMSDDERQQERRWHRDLASLNTRVTRQKNDPDLAARLERMRRGYEAFQLNLYVKYPDLKVQRGEMRGLEPRELDGLLPGERGALVEYLLTTEAAYLFVYTRPGGLSVYPLSSSVVELAAKAASFRRQLANRDLAMKAPARELYDKLLAPARRQLAGVTRLVIAPDGPLWELPFQALQTATGRYLLEDYAIAYVPSWTALREMNKRRTTRAEAPSLLAFAGGNLPNAAREVQGIQPLYRGAAYTGPLATEAKWKAEAGRFDVLHVATHGVLNDASPMYSHLALAAGGGSDPQDGMLEAWEIMNMDLKARLVVLSACETARGRAGSGEGVIGLSWALFVAGSPATVVSQWKVDSASTTDLMLAFHRGFRSQGQSPAEALRAAALQAARTGVYRHPFYWAGFVVVGAGF
ncbi:MAG: CHAT domain-containing protein [Acidobacteria bacterium]|nr:CHAT domain-containing protein [Acidobacteriota bacterium]